MSIYDFSEFFLI